MTHKSLLLACCSLLLLSVNTNAQDKLYKMNGESVNVKVKEVTSREITFKKADNPDGPTYSIGTREVERIEYQNGSEDVFNKAVTHRLTKAEKVKYGKNIIALAPLQITDGIGLGLSYERVLDKKGIISFYLPFAMSFNDDNYTSGVSPTPLGNNNGYNNNRFQYNSYYIFPGVKIYPTGSKGKVRYSVGPSLALIFGQTVTGGIIGTNPANNYPLYGDYLADRFTLGIMVNNTLNIQPTPHLYMGLELGLGVSYLNTVNNVNVGQTGIGQFAFKMGYRF
jgi:hypothetical protein